MCARTHTSLPSTAQQGPNIPATHHLPSILLPKLTQRLDQCAGLPRQRHMGGKAAGFCERGRAHADHTHTHCRPLPLAAPLRPSSWPAATPPCFIPSWHRSLLQQPSLTHACVHDPSIFNSEGRGTNVAQRWPCFQECQLKQALFRSVARGTPASETASHASPVPRLPGGQAARPAPGLPACLWLAC